MRAKASYPTNSVTDQRIQPGTKLDSITYQPTYILGSFEQALKFN